METNKLVEKLNEIEMPKDMQDRMIRKCYMEMERKTMGRNRVNTFFKKPRMVVASLALCFCLTGITALATTDKLQGFFKDIIRWDGAVTGTSYEQATDEIEVSVVNDSDELIVSASIVNPKKAPYSIFETFGIESYKIVDMSDHVITEGKGAEMAELIDGKAIVIIPIDTITSGNYKLVINEFVGSAKADQPLVMSGTWECAFTR